MHSYKFNIRIRYGETDQMGVVYHGNYPQFIEIGRIEWLRSLGISYKEMEEEGVMLPVVSLAINYIKPVFYDDVISVNTTVKKKPTASIDFEYEITNASGEVVTTATTVLAFVNMKTKRPMRCPQYVLDKLRF
ncbi:MAG: acyl-CoA thioesterase [Flavobacteriaceae bacterium]|nr:acyl-CoA thioesterase [Flavobacteriaceae bacterium]